MPTHWYNCDNGFDDLLTAMGRERFVKVAAREMGYDSVGAWTDAGPYTHVTPRGSMRRGKYHQPCNEVSGELEAR